MNIDKNLLIQQHLFEKSFLEKTNIKDNTFDTGLYFDLTYSIYLPRSLYEDTYKGTNMFDFSLSPLHAVFKIDLHLTKQLSRYIVLTTLA